MSAEYNITFDWNRISTLGKVKVLVEQVVGSPSQEAINTAVANYIEAHPGSLAPLSPAVKTALLQIAEKVAYIDEHGQDYYDALDAALNAKALLSITAVYTQTGTVYDTDTLDSLKSDLVVTAYYDDGTTADVTSASVLSGSMAEGTNTITVTYSGKTATFQVTTVQKILYTLTTDDFGIYSLANKYSATNGYPSKTPYPYTLLASNRLTHALFDMTLSGGKTYKVELTGTEPNAQISTVFYNQTALNSVAGQTEINTANIYEEGWHADEVGVYNVTPPETLNNSPIVACRITLRKDANNSTISTNFVTSLTIREMPTE